MTPVELKFLLQLLGAPNYQAAITEIRPNPKTKAAERDRICLALCSKGLVDYSAEVSRFTITPAGRTLLNLDTTSLPVTPLELWTLRSCRAQGITPGQISRKVPASERQTQIRALAERGLVSIKQTQLKQVWLTAQGKQFLREDYQPQGSAPILSSNLLNHYVQFLRAGVVKRAIAPEPDSDQLLDIIRQLDQQLGTDNYLPIFYLREKLQPPLTREALNQQLYALQREDKIELSTLQDVTAYSEAQLAAGIPQDVGGALFFISLS
ncbi:MAG: hypothetical protein F6J97_14880 [Leptolyngbya sp. SIO4C1]|nr:hypothetical protein [Leptolyngbya sp. SIO4C1]